MKIAIIGAGGVGGYFGGCLARGGADTTFIVRGRTLEALRSRGLRVDSIKGDFVVTGVKATDNPAEVGPVDAVIVTVKAWQVPEVAPGLGLLIGEHTAVVPLENGMESPDHLAAALGEEHVLGGLCGIVAFAVEPGHIRHIGADPFVMFGERDNRPSERTAKLQEAFLQAGVSAEIPPDINRSMWTKFLFIAGMSGIGSAARVPVGVWRSQPETRSLAVRLLGEILAVAAARGVTLDPNAVQLTLDRYDGLPPESTSSLQRDVMDGKPSELDAQVGAVVRMAREAGIDAPVCETLYSVLLPQERKARAL